MNESFCKHPHLIGMSYQILYGQAVNPSIADLRGPNIFGQVLPMGFVLTSAYCPDCGAIVKIAPPTSNEEKTDKDRDG